MPLSDNAKEQINKIESETLRDSFNELIDSTPPLSAEMEQRVENTVELLQSSTSAAEHQMIEQYAFTALSELITFERHDSEKQNEINQETGKAFNNLYDQAITAQKTQPNMEAFAVSCMFINATIGNVNAQDEYTKQANQGQIEAVTNALELKSKAKISEVMDKIQEKYGFEPKKESPEAEVENKSVKGDDNKDKSHSNIKHNAWIGAGKAMQFIGSVIEKLSLKDTLLENFGNYLQEKGATIKVKHREQKAQKPTPDQGLESPTKKEETTGKNNLTKLGSVLESVGSFLTKIPGLSNKKASEVSEGLSETQAKQESQEANKNIDNQGPNTGKVVKNETKKEQDGPSTPGDRGV